VNYVLVKAQPGVEAGLLAARIREQVEGVEAIPTSRFLANDFGMVMQMGVQLIGLMTGISSSLAALLIAFTLYVHTIHQRRELAILKAVGFPDRSLYLSVMVQAFVLCAAGFIVAVALAHLVTWLTAHFAPQITMRVSANVLVKVAAGGFGVALVATFVPAWQVARVDPQSAFQS
jgi:putative ABC transport system permease protein